MIQGKTILITGGSGSFGHLATQKFVNLGAAKIIIYSRDEYKQHLMKRAFPDERVVFKIGDVRDLQRLTECTQGVDVLIHAAAMKHVDICEKNPQEAHKTNQQGSQNVVHAAIANSVPISINLSADKAVYPAGVYGTTKAASEDIFTKGNHMAKNQGKTSKFVSLRYSNVLGSRGSVVEIFQNRLSVGETVTVFNDKMIRLVITQEEVVKLVTFAIENAVGGEIFLYESPVLRISDLANAMHNDIGKGSVIIKNEMREGEKYDAILLSAQEAQRTLVADGYLVIIPKETLSSRYTTVYGNTPFLKGEFGTHNAKYLNHQEIIQMIR